MKRNQIEKRLEDARQKACEAREILEELYDDCQSYYDDRSEKWQESEAGEAYMEIIERIDCVKGDAEQAEYEIELARDEL